MTIGGRKKGGKVVVKTYLSYEIKKIEGGGRGNTNSLNVIFISDNVPGFR